MMIECKATSGGPGAIWVSDRLVKVMAGNISSTLFRDNLLQKQDRTMWMVSLCSDGGDVSIDVHVGLLRSIVNLKVTWPEVARCQI